MGQYYFPVDLDKLEYLHPHKFGDGLKLREFGESGCGTMFALAALLSNGNGRGGGDIFSPTYFKAEEAYFAAEDRKEVKFPNATKLNSQLIGSWAGDRIVIGGDYADPYKFIPTKYKKELYNRCLADQQTRSDIDKISQKTLKQYAKNQCNIFHFAEYFCKDISDDIIQVLKDCNCWERETV